MFWREICDILYSFWSIVPCEPQNMSVAVQCDTRTATLSWGESQGSLKYFTWAQTMDGNTLHCDTTGTSCSLRGLTCGTMYNFTAQASDGTCNSSVTAPIQRGAGTVYDQICLRMFSCLSQEYSNIKQNMYVCFSMIFTFLQEIIFCKRKITFPCVLEMIFSVKHITWLLFFYIIFHCNNNWFNYFSNKCKFNVLTVYLPTKVLSHVK